MIEIKHCITGEIIYSTDATNICEAIERAVREGVNLRYADLHDADLRYADLYEANLSRANLYKADLSQADLTKAILDFSCLPLWCGSFGMKVDSRFIRQLAAHICRLKCDEPEGKAIQRLLRPARNAFCRDRSDVREVE